MTMTVNTPPQVAEAREVVAKLETLSVGDSISFDPPIPTLVVHVLYLLLGDVNKGWRITAAPETGSWWSRLKSSLNQPVNLGGRPIPQIIAEIQRTR